MGLKPDQQCYRLAFLYGKTDLKSWVPKSALKAPSTIIGEREEFPEVIHSCLFYDGRCLSLSLSVDVDGA